MARLVKEARRYYLVANGVYLDVSDAIEAEVRLRLALDQRLAEYNAEIDSRVHFKLAATAAQLITAKKHLAFLLEKAQGAFDAWAKTGNPHGAMIVLRPHLSIVQKWLDDTRSSD